MAAPDLASAPAVARYGEVYDRGYQHYEGPRLGRRHAIWALILYSMKRALGIKKGWGAKVIPILLYIGIALPVVVAIGLRAFLPTIDILDYPDFFGVIFIIEGIFVATIAPEMLCGDRRENVLPLYFSRPITRGDYLSAKLVATALLTLTVSLVPAAILWLGRQFLADSPLVAMRDHADGLGRIVIAGAMIAFYLGAIGLVISSFTGRKSIAVGVIIFGFLISETLAGALRFAIDEDNPIHRYLFFLSPTSTIGGMVGGLFREPVLGVDVSLGLILAVMIAIVVACCAVMYVRYVPNE